MKKIIVAVITALSVSVAGCGPSTPTTYPQGADYAQGYEQQPAPQVQSGGHGDALIAGALGAGAGYMLGKRKARKDYRTYYPRSYRPYRPTVVYRTVPSRSTYRSSSYGSYRSRRR